MIATEGRGPGGAGGASGMGRRNGLLGGTLRVLLGGLLLGAALTGPLSTGPARATEALTLRDVLTLGLEKNLSVLSAQQERDKAKGLLTEAKSALFPSLTAVGSATRRNDDSAKPERESQGSLEISQYLYAGGVVRAGERQALLNLRKAEEDLQETRESVALEIYEAYCGVLLKAAELETARDALGYYERAAKELRKRLELGLSTKLDLARAEQQKENARVDRIAAENALSTARIVLFTLLRMPPDAPEAISGDLAVRLPRVDRAEAIATGLRERPDLQSLRTAAGMQKEAVEIARAGLRPTATLTGSYQFAYDSEPYSSSEEDEWEAVLSVKVPLFDGGATRGKVAQAQALLTQDEQAVQKKEEAVRAEVTDACLTLESAAEAVGSAEKNLALARESLRLAEVGYREGVNTQLDVLDARTSLTRARQTLSQALRDQRVALARLWRSQGVLIGEALER